jgi:serine/threonine-protein kinase
MASGRVPFDAENFLGILTQHMYKAPPPIRKSTPAAQHISPALEAVILKCLSKRQDQRYQTMDEILAELDRLEAGEIPEAVSDLKNRTDEFAVPEDYFHGATLSVGSNPTVAPPRRHNFLLYGGVATLLAAVAIVSALIAQMMQSEDLRVDQSNPDAQEGAGAEAATPPQQQKKRTPQLGSTATHQEEIAVRQVAIATEPIDAIIFLNGKSIGSSPVLVDVAEGQQAKLEIRRSGYKTREVSVDGSEGRLSVRLEKVVSSPVRAPARNSGGKGKSPPGAELGDPWAKR